MKLAQGTMECEDVLVVDEDVGKLSEGWGRRGSSVPHVCLGVQWPRPGSTIQMLPPTSISRIEGGRERRCRYCAENEKHKKWFLAVLFYIRRAVA